MNIRDVVLAKRVEFIAATLFLTRIPLPVTETLPEGLSGRAMTWYPLIGALIGLASGLVFLIASLLGLGPPLAALLAVLAAVAITGGLHEDGLADTADGLGGGADREAKLAIMRDSRIGGYGTLALVFSVFLRAAALADFGSIWLPVAAAIAAGALSRLAMVGATLVLEPARTDGLGAGHGRLVPGLAGVALMVGVVIAYAVLGIAAVAALLVAGGAAAALGWLARRLIGGYTGDVLGAIQQVSEIAVLVMLAGLIGR